MNITSVAGICILFAAVILLLKQYKPEYAMLAAAAASGALLVYLLSLIFPVIQEIREILAQAGVNNEHFTAVFKAVGICYTAQFAGDICRDFGQTAIAGKIDMAGKIAVVALSLPLMKEILQMTLQLIG